MMGKLLGVPGLRGLIPFVRATYGRPSCDKWRDEEGNQHDIRQCEGEEQGDPLLPLLFSLAIQNSLRDAEAEMAPGELLFAYLDDV